MFKYTTRRNLILYQHLARPLLLAFPAHAAHPLQRRSCLLGLRWRERGGTVRPQRVQGASASTTWTALVRIVHERTPLPPPFHCQITSRVPLSAVTVGLAVVVAPTIAAGTLARIAPSPRPHHVGTSGTRPAVPLGAVSANTSAVGVLPAISRHGGPPSAKDRLREQRHRRSCAPARGPPARPCRSRPHQPPRPRNQ